MKVLISGGGSGGHVFPAIAIAEAIKKLQPDAEFLFVGAKGKIEMEKVPKAGYKIIGLWISGFQRKLTLKNLMFPIKLINSLWRARGILKRFQPDVTIGVGGFASGPVLEMATRRGLKTMIQEQNSHPGITNRLLAKKVDKICVAYDNVKRFFPEDKMIMTGNPVRKDIVDFAINVTAEDRIKGLAHFGLSEHRKTIFVVGGSLGARTLNRSMAANLDLLRRDDLQVIWQVGKLYEEEYLPKAENDDNVKAMAFVDRMDLAYAVADVVISRAGALSIAELCLTGKPTIFVPSPNVAENHQMANAMELVVKGAANIVEDVNAERDLIKATLELLDSPVRLKKLSENIKSLAVADAADRIAKEAIALANES